MQNKGHRGVRIALAAGGALALLVIALLSVYMLWERAPAVEQPVTLARGLPAANEKTTAAEPVAAEPENPGLPFDTRRQDGLYTILLVGNDNGAGNTDTIIVGRLDTRRHKMDFVSIPRDTLIDVDWEVKKLNAVYWGAVNVGGDGSEALRRHIRRLIGFDVDCYAVLDLGDFIDVIDAMGGVYFDVPQAMHYEDLGQDLRIHLEPGYQLLDGEAAMGLVRFRSGYVTGDLGRIEMQHRFLKACAEQFISLGKIPNVGKVIDILSAGLDTNLSAANIAWFLRQALLCDSESIRFSTAPCSSAMIGGYSYAVLSRYEWINMVNERLNPFDAPVTEDMVSIAFGRSDTEAANQTASPEEAAVPAAVISEPAPEEAAPSPAPETPAEPDAGEAPEDEPEGEPEEEPGPSVVIIDPDDGEPDWQELLAGQDETPGEP